MIAILLATFNGAAFIEEMLDSLKDQTFGDYICYIHDDGSSDKTVSICSDWIANNNEHNRFKIIEHSPLGGSKENFLWMLSFVDAEYYMFADQDDVWLPQKIQKTFDAIGKIDTPKAVFCDMFVTDSELSIIDKSFIKSIGRDPYDLRLQRIVIDNPAAGCTMLINKPLRDIAIRIKELSLIEMHDGFICALAVAVGELSFVDESLVYYRQHCDNVMGADTKDSVQKINENIRIAKKGSFLAKKREFHMHEVNLAKALLEVGEFQNTDTKVFLEQLSLINTKSKLKRIAFYKKNKINRANHNLWFLLWV